MDTEKHDNTWADMAVATLLYRCISEAEFELARWALQLGREQ